LWWAFVPNIGASEGTGFAYRRDKGILYSQYHMASVKSVTAAFRKVMPFSLLILIKSKVGWALEAKTFWFSKGGAFVHV